MFQNKSYALTYSYFGASPFYLLTSIEFNAILGTYMQVSVEGLFMPENEKKALGAGFATLQFLQRLKLTCILSIC
jgi:hypothetical protein